MAININLLIDQGTKYEAFATVTNEDGGIFDLTNWTPKGQLRKSYYSTTSVNFTVDVYGEPQDGKIKLTLLPSQTNAMRPGRYVYDVEVTDIMDAENVKRVLQGTATITPNVTKI